MFRFSVTSYSVGEVGRYATITVVRDGAGHRIASAAQSPLDAARDKIISGEIVVHDYTTDGACPAS